jgi:hypothetical protein
MLKNSFKNWKHNLAKVFWKHKPAISAILWFHRQLAVLSAYLAPGDSFAIFTP